MTWIPVPMNIRKSRLIICNSKPTLYCINSPLLHEGYMQWQPLQMSIHPTLILHQQYCRFSQHLLLSLSPSFYCFSSVTPLYIFFESFQQLYSLPLSFSNCYTILFFLVSVLMSNFCLVFI